MFPGDREFGQWRAERTSIASASTANKYMAVARKFSDKHIAGKVSYSVLKELLPASESVINKVESASDAGEKVTKSRVRREIIADRLKEDDTVGAKKIVE